MLPCVFVDNSIEMTDMTATGATTIRATEPCGAV